MRRLSVAIALMALLLPARAPAAELMPDFATVPSGWSQNVLPPGSFTDIGTAHGASNVLGIDITNGPTGNYSFYGESEQHSITGGVGDMLSAYLWLPGSWASPTNGAISTAMWASLIGGCGGPGGCNDSLGIGFTNDNLGSSTGTFEYYNENGPAWVGISSVEPNYDAWNLLQIDFVSNSAYDLSINGVEVATLTPLTDNMGFNEAIIGGTNPNGSPVGPAFQADYANVGSLQSAVPEPGSLSLLLVPILGLLSIRRKEAG